MCRDITDQLLRSLDAAAIDQVVGTAKQAMTPSSHPQAWLMFAKLAAHHSDSFGDDERDEYYDFSHAMNFRALVTCLTEFIDPAVEFSYEEPLRPDEEVRRLFKFQLMNETNLHQAACMRNGLRRAWYDPEADRGELRLTKRRRRAALTLIDPVAQSELLRTFAGWNDAAANLDEDDVYFACASADEHLRFVRDADPKSWARFEAATGITADLLTSMSGFLVFLEVSAKVVDHSLAYSEELLEKLGALYKTAFPNSAIGAGNAVAMVRRFSLSPQESRDLLLPVPFFRIGARYLRYHGFSQIMSPAMGLLTILIRGHEQDWNNSVGSTLARAADAIASTLPPFEHLRIATRRKLKKGDIDLALFDVRTRHLLLCEVKTVYDKHRTVLHMHRFEEAKVKVDHAVAQLREAAELVRNGVDMHGIFHAKLPAPLRVSGALLTWFDPVDLTVGTRDEDILSLNFATFRYLLRVAGGDLDHFHQAAHDLRNVWCVAELRPIDLQVEFDQRIEVQIGAVDAAADIRRVKLSPLARDEVAKLPALDAGWSDDQSQPAFVSYLEDTVATLGAAPQGGRSA